MLEVSENTIPSLDLTWKVCFLWIVEKPFWYTKVLILFKLFSITFRCKLLWEFPQHFFRNCSGPSAISLRFPLAILMQLFREIHSFQCFWKFIQKWLWEFLQHFFSENSSVFFLEIFQLMPSNYFDNFFEQSSAMLL